MVVPDATRDATYRRHLEQRAARAAYIDEQRSEDPTWNGKGRAAPATQYEKRAGIIRGKSRTRRRTFRRAATRGQR